MSTRQGVPLETTDFDDFDGLCYAANQLEFAMTTLARTASAPSLDIQGRKELSFVLADITAGLAAKLSSLVNAQLTAKKISPKAVEKVVAEKVPGLLEEAFVTGLLVSKAAAEQRAVLLHLLSTVQVQSLGLTEKALPRDSAASAGAREASEDDELTSEAAAKLLHVSRSHLNTLADSGALGEIRRTAGNHRRISKTALLEYKARSKERQGRGLDAMMAASQKLGLYDDELAGIPRRASR
ncbi:DNA binding domain-containing protein, excisionase family [Variovorax sp. NFACC28]|nr:DNA binding domain-containing protein, excisionase family [Variovorax sp. NFACC28]SEG99266.1 DNA binding domain-containing protein, excisionase family [Variovorax sp. NFACC29]SFE20293.1 DNA binding domain-containing protein, excisionase family [Variovorax sp. NFACC26]SFH25730.1 DNA binding domain-containing protein, excisionase family [Variovorax sp. NFACC27]